MRTTRKICLAVVMVSALVLLVQSASYATTVGLYHLDDGSGMVLTDSSPLANDGHKGLVSPWDTGGLGVTWGSGHSGGGLNFAGGYPNGATIPHDAAQNSLDLTVQAWINPTVGVGGYQTIIQKHWGTDFSTSNWKFWYINANTLAAQVAMVDDITGLSAGTIYFEGAANSVTPGTWQDVALTIDNSAKLLKLWVDGVEVGSAGFAGKRPQLTCVQDIFVGGEVWDNRWYTGAMDEIRLLDYAIPEPATMSLLGLGGMLLLRRRKKA